MMAKPLQLAFIGRIMSCYTHEVKNYLAIIKETGGLMKDVIRIKKGKGMDEKQFLGLVEGIDEQINRAVAITDYLNRFAHRMESGSTTVSINELIEELLALMGRLAYRKRITFKKDLSRSLPETNLDPTAFHYLLFCLLDTKMSDLDRNGVVCVGSSYSGGCYRITVCTEGAKTPPPDASAAGDDAGMREAASDLGATVSETGKEIVITVPAAQKQ